MQLVNASLRTKIGLALAVALAIFAYLILVDVGISAGKIHHGVSVSGVDVGGLTEAEALDRLEKKSDEIAVAPILLLAPGYNIGVKPDQLNWDGAPRLTARAALRVGRDDVPFGAVADRISAWLWGVQLEFVGRPERKTFLQWVKKQGDALECYGFKLDRFKLRRLIIDAARRGETGPFDFPVTETGAKRGECDLGELDPLELSPD